MMSRTMSGYLEFIIDDKKKEIEFRFSWRMEREKKGKMEVDEKRTEIL